MLHVWLIPALVVLGIIVFAFYLLMRYKGGSGLRTEGRTLVDQPEDDQDRPP